MEKKNNGDRGIIILLSLIIILLIVVVVMLVIKPYEKKKDNNNVTDNNTVNKDGETKNEVSGIDLKIEKYTLKYIYYNTRKEEDEYEYIYNKLEKNDKIEFYKDGIKVSEYVCKSNYCSILDIGNDYSNDEDEKYIYGPIIKILEHEKDNDTCIDCYGHDIIENKNGLDLKLYNIETEKLIKTLKVKDEIYSFLKLDSPLVLVRNMNDKYVLLDLNGKEYKKFDKLGNRPGYDNSFIDLGVDSNYKYIIYAKNGKYGLETIIDNKVIFDFKYDNIIFYNNEDYLILTENGLSYLYDLKNNKKVNNIGYEKIISADYEKLDYLLVYKDKIVSLIDIKGNKITDILKTDLYEAPPKFSGGMRSYFENNIYYIDLVTKDPYDLKSDDNYMRSFEYNVTSKTLKEVKK